MAANSLVGEAVRLRNLIATARAALDAIESMLDDQLPISQTAETLGVATIGIIARCASYDQHLRAPSALKKR